VIGENVLNFAFLSRATLGALALLVCLVSDVRILVPFKVRFWGSVRPFSGFAENRISGDLVGGVEISGIYDTTLGSSLKNLRLSRSQTCAQREFTGDLADPGRI
jgi:hypothetical protein